MLLLASLCTICVKTETKLFDRMVHEYVVKQVSATSSLSVPIVTWKLILRDVLGRGIDYPEILLGLLGDYSQAMTIEQIFQFIEAKESGKHSATRLLDTHSAQAIKSDSLKVPVID